MVNAVLVLVGEFGKGSWRNSGDVGRNRRLERVSKLSKGPYLVMKAMRIYWEDEWEYGDAGCA